MADNTDFVEAVARAICEARHGEVWSLLSPEEIDFMYCDAYAAIRAYREALEASGWQVVPKQPTTSMLHAGIIERDDCNGGMFSVYRAMLSAAPNLTDPNKRGGST